MGDTDLCSICGAVGAEPYNKLLTELFCPHCTQSIRDAKPEADVISEIARLEGCGCALPFKVAFLREMQENRGQHLVDKLCEHFRTTHDCPRKIN